MKRLLFLFVPLALFAQVSIDTVIHLPTEKAKRGFYIPELDKLYVTGRDGFIVVDCSTYQVKTQIPAMTGLARFAWNRLSQKLYITCNPRPDSTMVVDAVADTIIGWLDVCREMHQFAYLSDVGHLYKPAVETLYAFDGATDSLVRKRTLGGVSTNVTWDSVGRKLYVGQGGRKELYVYDYLADSVLKVIDLSPIYSVQPDALVFNNTYRKAYVAPFQVEPWKANVGIIDTKHDTLLSVLPVRIWCGLNAQVAVNEQDDKVYLADNDTDVATPDTLWVVDCATDSVLKKVEYEHRGHGAWLIRWVPWSNRLYLVIHQPDTAHYTAIAVLDCNTDSLIVPAMLLTDGYISDIQLDPLRQRIFVIGVDDSDVYVLRDTGHAGVADAKPAGPRPVAGLQLQMTAGGYEVGYSIASPSRVDLCVYDLMGREVRRLVGADQPAGQHRMVWDSRNHGGSVVARGVYFVRLDTPSFSDVKKAVVTR